MQASITYANVGAAVLRLTEKKLGHITLHALKREILSEIVYCMTLEI
jgi:hypothetical protein